MDLTEKTIGDHAERDGPPNVSEAGLNQLDQKATLEEISQLQQFAASDDAVTDEEH